MYRLLIFTVLLNFASCGQRVSSCHSKSAHSSRNLKDYFHKLAHQQIWTEKKFENAYKQNMCVNIREVYNTNCYSLKYPMHDFGEKDIVVKVLHKTIYVGADCKEPKKSFRDVKMLPDNLNAEAAWWCLVDGELQISFPYKTPLGTETKKQCGDINYSVITVPNVQPVAIEPLADEPPCDSALVPVF